MTIGGLNRSNPLRLSPLCPYNLDYSLYGIDRGKCHVMKFYTIIIKLSWPYSHKFPRAVVFFVKHSCTFCHMHVLSCVAWERTCSSGLHTLSVRHITGVGWTFTATPARLTLSVIYMSTAAVATTMMTTIMTIMMSMMISTIITDDLNENLNASWTNV